MCGMQCVWCVHVDGVFLSACSGFPHVHVTSWFRMHTRSIVFMLLLLCIWCYCGCHIVWVCVSHVGAVVVVRQFVCGWFHADYYYYYFFFFHMHVGFFFVCILSVCRVLYVCFRR